MAKMQKFFHTLNENLFFILSTFLLIFIPLFPKIPLFDILPGYIVRVRPEDFLVLCTALVWLRDIRAKRIVWNTSYFWFVFFYACAGLLSILLGIFLLKTIPLQLVHIAKSALHFIRYLEYFSVFFFFYSAMKTKRHIVIAFTVLTLTLLGVVGYGLGQKYLHFPVYSTMNREYSKGEKLYLENDARPQSTFAGPYDLAAFLVITLPLLFSLSLGVGRSRSLFIRVTTFIALQTAHLLGLGMLVLTGSAISLTGYILAMIIVLVLHLIRLPSIKLRVFWGSMALIMCIMSIISIWIVMPQRIRDKAVGFMNLPGQRSTPTDLVGDGYETKTVQIENPDGSLRTITIREKSAWSENALKYGLSMGIRLDTLWPQAILGFLRNPFTGSGYGTLAMLDSQKFMEADSTDNNFFRTIGETGLFGFITFYGIVLFLIRDVSKLIRAHNTQTAAASIGFIGSTFGLLTTAAYLDVFAASKVAFIFWGLAGLMLKNVQLEQTSIEQKESLLKHIVNVKDHVVAHWPLYVVFIFSFFTLHQNPYMNHNPTKDIDSISRGVEQLASARCFLNFQRFDLCRNTGLTLAPHPSLYVLMLTPLLFVFHNYGVFYYLSIGIIFLIIFCTYRFIHKRTQNQRFIFLSLTSIPVVAMLFRFTNAPLTDFQLFFIIVGFPLISLGFLRVLKHQLIQTHLSTQKGFFTTLTLLLIVSFFSSNITTRFRNISPNFAYAAVQLANNFIISTNTSSYLITTLNPYFVDLYSSNNYSLLPLSKAQEYASSFAQVWGVSNSTTLQHAYDSLLRFGSQIFVSDYGIYAHPAYTKDFLILKQSYDLAYTSLGCNETCNLYAVQLAKPLVSDDIVSVFNGKRLSINQVTSPYEFSIVSSRFDTKLSDPNARFTTVSFTKKLQPLKEAKSSFLFLTGDFANDDSSQSAKYVVDNFVDKVSFPVLYNAGNFDTMPSKYFKPGFQTFFTHSEYVILLDVDQYSHINIDQQLHFYTTLLRLEKLPQIKNLFIVAHDLDWQNINDPINATHMIERKLKDFPYLNVYIVSANHSSNLLANDNWFALKKDNTSNITYVSGLVAGNNRDHYIQVQINEKGEARIEGKKLAQ